MRYQVSYWDSEWRARLLPTIGSAMGIVYEHFVVSEVGEFGVNVQAARKQITQERSSI